MLSLLLRSCLPSQGSRTSIWGPPGRLGQLGAGGGRQGRRWKEGQRRSIRIRKGVSVAAVKGLQSEWEPGMTVSRSKLMIM